MAFMKTSLISRPVESLGLDWGDLGGGVSKVINFFGSGIKAQGAQEALAAQLALQAQQQQMQQRPGISTTTLLIGGVAVAGVLFLVMRKK